MDHGTNQFLAGRRIEGGIDVDVVLVDVVVVVVVIVVLV